MNCKLQHYSVFSWLFSQQTMLSSPNFKPHVHFYFLFFNGNPVSV
uniref:Uncharacterized protein n=1 Tax=Rhizophora mucronata TaxID=61149 RepID=A0A2P2N021_RHIMU